MVFGLVAALVLAGLSLLVFGVLGGGLDRDDDDQSSDSSCTVPNLAGTVVTVSLTDDADSPDGQHSRMTSGTTMSLTADRTAAPAGTVSFLAVNGGGLNHELIIFPLADGESVGSRALGSDLTVTETGSIGEASAACGEGTGAGIVPDTSSWVTLDLAPGRYELYCNLPGHYGAGMYTELTVT